MRALLHLGYPKTGTTSLQTALYAGRSILSRDRILYPDAGIFQNRHAHLAWSCMALGSWAAGNYSGRSTEEILLDIKKDVESKDVQWLIISTEELSYQCPNRFAPLIQGLRNIVGATRVDAIVYLRPHVSALESMYRQLVRNRRYASTFEIFVDEVFAGTVPDPPYGPDAGTIWGGSLPPYDYFRFVKEWCAVVDRVEIGVYCGDTREDIVSAFFRLLDVDPPPMLTHVRRRNEPIDGSQLELLRRINTLPEHRRSHLVSDILEAHSSLNVMPTPLASERTALKIRRHFHSSNRQLVQNFFGGIDPFTCA